MAMFEKAEDEYNDLISKKNIIEVGLAIYKFLDNQPGLSFVAACNIPLLLSSSE
jgi:hypothetical protein